MLEYKNKDKRSDLLDEDKESILAKWMILGTVIEESARTYKYSDDHIQVILFWLPISLQHANYPSYER